MGKLFGTDGIRGVANVYPITSEMAVNAGRAVACFFKGDGTSNTIVVGKDTRISGDMLVSAIVSGICSMGVDVFVVDTFPTPGVAFLTKKTGSMAGIMISASHNPFEDNGIKLFDKEGFKPSVDMENQIEKMMLEDQCRTLSQKIKETGTIRNIKNAPDAYIDFLRTAVPDDFSLKHMKIVMDCANGATSAFAPKLYERLGATVVPLFIHPDGKNINHGCGSQHPDQLQNIIVEQKADIGLAYDGDGDRLIAVDEKGSVLTGDQIMFVCAGNLKKNGMLKNDTVVSTVMSNVGFKDALSKMGIQTMLTDVGDRHVMEKMKAVGAILGGEDSGHTIFLNHHTTGDGILTSLKLMEAMVNENQPISALAGKMTVFPQVLINVNVKTKPDLSSIPQIRQAILDVENQLGEKGRVLVRYSGTQAMCRVMVEGSSAEKTKHHAESIAQIIGTVLG